MEDYRGYATGLHARVRPLREESRTLEAEIHDFFLKAYLTMGLSEDDQERVETLYRNLYDAGWLQYALGADECHSMRDMRSAGESEESFYETLRQSSLQMNWNTPGLEGLADDADANDDPLMSDPQKRKLSRIEQEVKERANTVTLDDMVQLAADDPEACCAMVEAEIHSLQVAHEELDRAAIASGIDDLSILVKQATVLGAPMGLSAWEYIALGAEDINNALRQIYAFVSRFMRGEMSVEELEDGPELGYSHEDLDDGEGSTLGIELESLEDKPIEEIASLLLEAVEKERKKQAAREETSKDGSNANSKDGGTRGSGSRAPNKPH